MRPTARRFAIMLVISVCAGCASLGVSAQPLPEHTTKIADKTGLTRRDVASVFDEMTGLIKKDLGRRGPGVFTVPGLMKIEKKHKPRRAARKGVNPFTGEEMMFKAKAAHNVIKVRALKNLKDMV